jgi:hypothetical protein
LAVSATVPPGGLGAAAVSRTVAVQLLVAVSASVYGAHATLIAVASTGRSTATPYGSIAGVKSCCAAVEVGAAEMIGLGVGPVDVLAIDGDADGTAQRPG